MFKAVQTTVDGASPAGSPPPPALHRNLTLADAQAALNRVRGIRLTARLLQHLPALAEVIEHGGKALLPAEILRETAISLTNANAGLQDREAEAFAIIGIASTYGRATGQIGKARTDRAVTLVVDAQGLHLTASAGPAAG